MSLRCWQLAAYLEPKRPRRCREAANSALGPHRCRVRAAGLVILLVGYTASVAVFRTDTTGLAFLPIGFVLVLGMGTFQGPNNSAMSAQWLNAGFPRS